MNEGGLCPAKGEKAKNNKQKQQTTKKKQEKRESRAKQERAVLFDQRLSQHFQIPIRPVWNQVDKEPLM